MVVAAGVLAIFTATAIVAMTQMNRYAASSRLQTLAMAIAQQRVDEIRIVNWRVPPGVRPPILAQTNPTDPPAVLDPNGGVPLVLNDDPNNATAASSLDFAVPARLYTFIKNVNARSITATVVVAYTYRSRNYRVQLTTHRTTNNR